MPNNPPVPAPAADPPNTQWLNVSRYNTQNVIGSTSGGGSTGVFPGRVASGNQAAINNGILAPGDPVKQQNNFSSYQVINVNDQLVGDLGSIGSRIAGETVYTSLKNTGTTGGLFYSGVECIPVITSDSTGPISNFCSVYAQVYNYGSGNISGSVFGFRSALSLYGSGTIGFAYGLFLTGYKDPAAGAITNAYGIYINDFSTMGTTTSYNLRSLGVSSINALEGILRLGPATVNSNPHDGDLWYDGTHLNFRHGSTTTVLV